MSVSAVIPFNTTAVHVASSHVVILPALLACELSVKLLNRIGDAMKRPGVASAGGLRRVRRLRHCNPRRKCGCSRRWRRLYCLDCLSGPGLVSGSEVDNDLSSTQLAARETDEARSREPPFSDPYEPPSPSKRTVLSLAASHSSNRQGQDFVSNAVHICKTQECHARKVSHLASSCEGFSVAFTLEYTGEIPFCKTERSFPSVTCMSIGHVASLMERRCIACLCQC